MSKTSTVSEAFEIVIPEELREDPDLGPGKRVEFVRRGDHIELVPIRSIRQARGFLKGINTTIKRESDRL